MHRNGWQQTRLAVLIAAVLGLGACGGGGGTKPTPPPVEPGNPEPPPTTPSDQPPLDIQLTATHAAEAHDEGWSGKNITIGFVDTGIMRNHPALSGRVQSPELVYIDPKTNNTSIDDVVGHGTWVAEIAAGKAYGRFPGGIAPSAKLVSARIISDERPTDDGSGKGNEVTADDAVFFSDYLNPDLVSAGVQVMNNSWGGIYWDTSKAAINSAFGNAYVPFVKDHGGLVVFAAGNESLDNPSDIASLPTVAPGLGLDKGWLVAVAVDSNHLDQLADYSNQCGRTKNYCLAAPGDVVVGDKDAASSAQADDYWIVNGTSFAAPIVSGAAALVWEAFPYFDNDLVRQTLLGTADDIGAPGVDAVFGYGMLNVGKAVHGPGRFDWGTVTVKLPGSTESSWDNPISGAGGLVKQGDGTLHLTAASSYTGLTQVTAGTLTAQALASSVDIAAGGTLTATPGISGSVTNQGVFGVIGGDVTVGGDYTQAGSGRLSISLGSTLLVEGKANINGGDLYVVGINEGYVASSHTSVLLADGGLKGTFSKLATPSSVTLSATLNYAQNEAWLDVSQVKASAVQGMNYTPASFGSALRVDGAFDAINAQLGGVAGGLAGSFIDGAGHLQQSASTTALERSLSSLSGELHTASLAMTFEAIDAGTRALSARFDQLRDAPAAGNWSQGLGYHGNFARGGYGNVGFDLGGTLVGMDRRVGGSGYAGFALSQTRGLGRLAESADQGRSHALEGMLYGGVVQGNWYGMGRFGVGNYRELTRRQLQLGALRTGVESHDQGRYGVAYAETGYRVDAGALRLTPYTSVQYAEVCRDGFNERGGFGFGLKAEAGCTSRWQSGLGLRGTRQWSFAHGASLALGLHAEWQRAFGLRGELLNASFSGLDQWSSLDGIGLSRHRGVTGGSLDWSMSARSNLVLGVDRYSGQRDDATMATLSFRRAF